MGIPIKDYTPEQKAAWFKKKRMQEQIMLEDEGGSKYFNFTYGQLQNQCLLPLKKNTHMSPYERFEGELSKILGVKVNEIVLKIPTSFGFSVLVYTTLDCESEVSRKYGSDAVRIGLFFKYYGQYYYYKVGPKRLRTKNLFRNLTDSINMARKISSKKKFSEILSKSVPLNAEI